MNQKQVQNTHFHQEDLQFWFLIKLISLVKVSYRCSHFLPCKVKFQDSLHQKLQHLMLHGETILGLDSHQHKESELRLLKRMDLD